MLRGTQWLHPLSDQGFVLAPSLRAWARGFGACPTALQELLPPALALGDPPTSPLAEILAGPLSERTMLPEAWTEAVQSDLAAKPVATAPEACGEPTLDRLRMRWHSAPAPIAIGYPAWGLSAHPCGDPFHWMAEGILSYRAQAMERALRAFTWAHAHFTRLGSPFWAERAVANAMHAALFWGDVPGLLQWRAIQGPQPSPQRELEELSVLAVRDEWDQALPLARKLMSEYPALEQPWYYLAQRGLDLGRQDWVQEALPHLVEANSRLLFEAFLDDFQTPLPADLALEHTLIWRYHLALRSPSEGDAFWVAWRACPHQPLRLDSGLALLERLPSERSAARLLELQVLADRTESPRHQQRLRPLWPEILPLAPEDPVSILKAALARRGLASWLIWGPPERPMILGFGSSAPDGALSHLHRHGSLAPFEAQGLLWWGFPLSWEGGTVGYALAALDPQAPPDACADLRMLAPWLARLNPHTEVEPPPEGGALLADGSEPMAGLLRELARVAPSELSLLVLGPTGSGKELTAREIHRHSGRSGPLVAVNCSAFVESLMESELFGHVKGAFTGADRDRRGAIEAADKGTLFLDEVADLSPKIQSLFLRVLQEREVRRVGTDRAIHVDVRFVAATHRSLEDLATAGAFRRDLLYRLQGSVLQLPSLRERRHEFPYLVPRLIAQVARDAKRAFPELAPGLPQALSRLPWPGNFRELRHALERALLRCGEGTLKAEHFPELQIPSIQERTWEQATRDFQRRLLLDTLRQHRFQVSEAALALGITRPALYVAAKRMGLDLIAAREAWGAKPDQPTP
jgi:transcriptional regulator with AAA-type ATPase domain